MIWMMALVDLGCLGMPIILPCGTCARCIEIKADKHTKKIVIVCCLCVVSQEAGYDIPKLLELGHSPNALCAAKVPVKELVKANVPLERSLAMILPTDVPQFTDMWMNRSISVYCIHRVVYSYNQVFGPFHCLKLAYSGSFANLRTLHSWIHCQGDPRLGQLDTKHVWWLLIWWLQVGVQHSTFSSTSSLYVSWWPKR